MTKLARFTLQRVHYVPKVLEAGILYLSEEFEVAAHLCACGCQNKVVTPLGPAEWTFTDATQGPSLTPSIGNWQLTCRSHYVIESGRVRWASAWSPGQIENGRRAEEGRRKMYFELRRAEERFVAKARRWFGRLLSWFRR